MIQILVELDINRDVARQMAEVRKAWGRGQYRSLLLHVFSGLDADIYTTEVAQSLRYCFPEAKIVGTMSAGEIKSGHMMERGVLITAVLFEDTDVRVMRYDNVRGNEGAIGKRICRDLDSIPQVKAAELLFPGTEVDTRPLFREMSLCDRGIKIFGGYSGGHMLNAPVHYSFDASGVMYNSVVITTFAGEHFHVDADKVIGWEPLGLPFRITRADGNRLMELDGRPAAEIYERFLQIDRSQHDNAAEGYTFPMMTEYHGVPWLRSTIHIEEDGSLDLHGFVEEGTSIQLSYGNPKAIVEMVDERLQEVRQFRPQVIWLYSCIVRKAFWDSYVDMEMEPFQALASTAGIHTWGEVLRDEDTGEVVEHNVTLLSVAMREGPAPEGALPSEVKVDDSVLRGPVAQLRRLTSMVYATMGELQKAHSDLQKAHSDLQVLNEKLVEMAERDALTGLFSRGKTEGIIQQVLGNTAETGRPVSLIMVDVDHFKQVNDVYGHHAGDVVLKRLAQLFREAVSGRHGSAAGRWGGEEFFLVLPETESQEAMTVAETLRRKAEVEAFPGVGKVTISLGVITLAGDMETRAVFSKVDKALYEAKEGGRNRVVVAE